jgi:hypothetical protein
MKNQIIYKRRIRNIFKYFLPISFLLFSAVGCSVFKESQKLDLTPFANSMITVASEIQYSLFQHRLVTVRKKANGPKVERLLENVNKLRKIIAGTIAYSIEIVTLEESNLSGSGKSELLAEYVESLERPVMEKPFPQLNLTYERLDEILKDVRSQKKFLDALGAAQPIINEVARVTGELTEETKILLDAAYLEITQEWDEEYEGALWATNIIKAHQMATLTAMYYLGEYTGGRQNSLDSVYNYDPLSKEMFPEGHEFSRADLLEIEKRFIYKMGVIQELKDLFKGDMDEYEEGLLELDNIKQAYNDALRKARNAIILWSRAHYQLSKGVTDPAQIDLMQLMIGTAGKVLPGGTIPGI